MTAYAVLPTTVAQRLREGAVIPAHPLALDAERRLDERRQRALTRYYLGSGAGGIAVGVHTTQFALHEPRRGLLRPVLELAAETARQVQPAAILVAGIVGPTQQAIREAELAANLGYHLGLISSGGLASWSEEALLDRIRAVAEVLPVFGFYLQPKVGGRVLSYRFWRQLADMENVMAIKLAPFDRYQTLEVVRAVVDSERGQEIALYTGNDDHILLDLVTPLITPDGSPRYMVGGLLGQWAVWTRKAVELLDRVHHWQATGESIAPEVLALASRLTEANAAIFDATHEFKGSIAGIHEILRRQGLLAGRWCLDREEDVSDGQLEAIERVLSRYPELTDDTFVAEHLVEWLN